MRSARRWPGQRAAAARPSAPGPRPTGAPSASISAGSHAHRARPTPRCLAHARRRVATAPPSSRRDRRPAPPTTLPRGVHPRAAREYLRPPHSNARHLHGAPPARGRSIAHNANRALSPRRTLPHLRPLATYPRVEPRLTRHPATRYDYAQATESRSVSTATAQSNSEVNARRREICAEGRDRGRRGHPQAAEMEAEPKD